MSAFGIYVIVLTVIYVIYFGVMLAYDQYGVKGQKKNEVEEFDSPDDDHKPSSRKVRENGDGTYSMTDSAEEEEEHDQQEVDDDGQGGIYDDKPEDDTTGETPEDEAPPVTDEEEEDDDESFAVYERIKQTQEEMMTIYPEFDEQYDAAEFSVVMNQPMEVHSRVDRTILRY